MLTGSLLQLGLSKKEAEVYLACLQLGYATVQKIADKAELNRTSTYTYIKNLMNRGLIKSRDKFGKQYFVAEKPEKLKYFYEQQERELQRRKQTIDKIMPELESLYDLAANRPSVKWYDVSKIDLMRNEMLSQRHRELLCLFNYEYFKDYINKNYIKQLLDVTDSLREIYIANKKIIDNRMRDLVEDDKYSLKYLPSGKFNILCEIVLFNNSVLIFRAKDFLLIKDDLFYQTFKILFYTLWEIAEDF